MKKLSKIHRFYIETIVMVICLLIAVTIPSYIVLHLRQNTKLKLTPEQKAVIVALNNARDEEIKAKEDLNATIEQAKNDVTAAFQAAQAAAMLTNNNVTTTWLEHAPNNCPTANGKFLLFGYRSDGFITWKAQ